MPEALASILRAAAGTGLLAGLVLALGVSGCAGRGAWGVKTGAVSSAAGCREPADSPATPAVRDLLRRARRDYRAGHFSAARDALRRLRRIAPREAAANELRARMAFELSDTEEYRAACREALAANPNSARVQSDFGGRLLEAGETQAGLNALRRAVELEPLESVHSLRLAQAYAELGRADEAQEVLESARRRMPDDGSLSGALASLAMARDDWDEAAALADAAVRWEPENVAWRLLRARAAYRLGDHQAAHDDYAACDEQALSDDDLLRFADASFTAGDVSRAEGLLESLAARLPERSKDVEALRGLCALKRGDEEAARAILEPALEQWPEDTLLVETAALLEFVSAEEPPPSR